MMRSFSLSLLVALAAITLTLFAVETPAKIETIEGQKVIHLKGSPYEIGFQHGTLLKEEIAHNINRFLGPIQSDHPQTPAVVKYFKEALPTILPHIPAALIEEMHGIADGAEIPYNKILMLNLFPEMFHCTGITVTGDATTNGTLYHVRVLDFAKAAGIQDTAVAAVVTPDQGIPFLNITYAGFIGCVTGMNAQKISIGEIGGKGYGYWDGMPMSFLLRQILQHASSLDDASQILEEKPRTCEYYYIFADGKTSGSFAVHATYNTLNYIHPGETYTTSRPLVNSFDTETPNNAQKECANCQQPKDCIALIRWDNFPLLSERINDAYGHIGLTELQEAIKEPIAHPSNLHNAIFAPETLDVWISHAGSNNEPACKMPYVHFNLSSLLEE